MRWSLDGPPNCRESSRPRRRMSTALVCVNLVSVSSSSSSSAAAAGGLEESQWPDKVFDMSSRVESIFLRMSVSASFSHSVQQPRSERHKAKRSLSASSFSHAKHSKEVGDMLSIYGYQQQRNHALL